MSQQAKSRLNRYGLLSVSGEDAREFLHAQLTVNVRDLPPERAALAGWCSAKGRLLATFLVIPAPQGYLLQLARDLAPAIAKRLSMFVLRSKVKVVDETERWAQFGVWDADGNANVVWDNGRASIPAGERRFLRLEPADSASL